MIVEPLLSYFNSKEVNLASLNRVLFLYIRERKRVGAITIGEAVRQRILELCQEQDISINALCTRSGVTQSTVNNIISRRNNSTTVSTIKKLCDGLGIDIQEFFNSDLFFNLEQEVK
ncbi:helix-turn-helix domain-containing protein [Lawsonibacter sp. LCP25S3_G6]|uniref:helix-turn-helix domain-containing protein n=1 Tax=unclassified Lawsonibacter TaxID=2617946 RepID=UPI003F97EC78